MLYGTRSALTLAFIRVCQPKQLEGDILRTLCSGSSRGGIGRGSFVDIDILQ